MFLPWLAPDTTHGLGVELWEVSELWAQHFFLSLQPASFTVNFNTPFMSFSPQNIWYFDLYRTSVMLTDVYFDALTAQHF